MVLNYTMFVSVTIGANRWISTFVRDAWGGNLPQLHFERYVGRLTFGSKELARDVEGFTPDDHYLLAIQELLCDGASKTTEQVTLAVNDNLHARGLARAGRDCTMQPVM